MNQAESLQKTQFPMKIFIPTPLRQYAGKKDAVEVRAATVGDALTELTSSHPDLKRHLYTEDGKLRAFVNLYLNDEDVRYLAQKEQTPVKDGDHLSIIPSIAGGKEGSGDLVIGSSGEVNPDHGCSLHPITRWPDHPISEARRK
jgi:adenylyltransferase/sulfurtransferase